MGEKIFILKVITAGINFNVTDYCQNYTYVELEYTPLPNGGVLIEFYCGSGGSLKQDMADYCPSGYICEDGACKPKLSTGVATKPINTIISKNEVPFQPIGGIQTIEVGRLELTEGQAERCIDADGDGYNGTPIGCGSDCNDNPSNGHVIINGNTQRGGCPTNSSECDEQSSRCAICIHPGAIEYCDTIDNDCNSLTADGLGEDAPNNTNFCKESKQVCNTIIGKWEDSKGTDEICNDKDDDCDGMVDLDSYGRILTRPTTNQVGECNGNLQYCKKGNWVNLSLDGIQSLGRGYILNYEPKPEICNNTLDDDCDNLTDCYDPDCTESGFCGCESDNDGGNIYLPGAVSMFSGDLINDTCFNNHLMEYTCENHYLNSTPYLCPFRCEDGACKNCSHFYDSENTLLTKSLDEYCVDKYPGVVREYSCDEDNVGSKSKLEPCPSNNPICYDGACKSCIDYDHYDLGYTSENKTEYEIFGITENETHQAEDYCNSSDILIESYCAGSNIAFKSPYSCSEKEGQYHVCKEGACVCVSSWVGDFQTCDSTETYDVTDVHYCSSSNEKTGFCDYNSNGILWSDDVSEINENDIYIEGEKFDDGEEGYNYNNAGILNVQIDSERNNGYVEFNWNFNASSLNLQEAKIETASNYKNFNYILINGLEISNKTAWFKSLNNSHKVCIKDFSGNITLDDFTNNCTGIDEVLVSCPGTNAGYHCDFVNTMFKVWPLAHSGVVEMTGFGIVSALICVENWTCGNWSNMTGECGTRTCTDSNNCTTITNKPLEAKYCAGCTPDWYCDSWGDCVEGEKTCKSYTDDSNCDVTYTGNYETKSCEENGFPWLIILLGVLGLVIIAGIIFFLIKKKKFKEEEESPSQTPKQPPRPPITPRANVYTPQQY